MGIFRRQNVWWIDYYANGQRMRERVGPSHRLAEDVLAKRKSGVAEGKFFPERQKQNVTFREMSKKYMDLHGQYLASTPEYMLKELLALWGDKKLTAITVGDIQEYYNQKSNKTSVLTANRTMTLIKSLFNRAKEWDMFYGDNPACRVKRGREEHHRLRFLSEAEIVRLIAVCHPRVRPVVACALMTGMRKGELLNLAWENISLPQGIIYILKSKSGKPRQIPIIPQLRDVFMELQPQARGSVFQLPEATQRKFFAKALNAAEIKEFRFHDLRHTFASHFIMRTNNLPVLQEIMGHATPQMTQRYAHLASGHISMQMHRFAQGLRLNGPQAQLNALPAPQLAVQMPVSGLPMDTYMDTKPNSAGGNLLESSIQTGR